MNCFTGWPSISCALSYARAPGTALGETWDSLETAAAHMGHWSKGTKGFLTNQRSG